VTRKKKLWGSAKKEFKDKPISTMSSILTGFVALTIIIAGVYSVITGEIPYPFSLLFQQQPKNPHIATAELQPEILTGGQLVDFSINYCNEMNSSPIDEIRIYKNEKFSDFQCNLKDGWELFFIDMKSKNACFYHASNPFYYINPGRCVEFEFIAKSPETGCDMVWELMSLDTNNYWMMIYETTSTSDCLN